MQWKWKEWEHSAVKMAWPWPGFIEVRHIAQSSLDDLEPCFGKLMLEEDDIRVEESEDLTPAP